MKNRRGFLQLLGFAPAVALAPKAMLDSLKQTNMGVALKTIPHPINQGVIVDPGHNHGPMRYLGLAQLKNEGDPTSFDPGAPDFSDEIERFSKEAFGRKELYLYQWYDDGEDEA